MFLHKNDRELLRDIIVTVSRIAPSARENVDVLEVAKELVHENFYEKDYNDSTLKLVTDDLAYETVRDNFLDIMEKVF